MRLGQVVTDLCNKYILPYSGHILPYSGHILPYSGHILPYSGHYMVVCTYSTIHASKQHKNGRLE